MQRTVSVGLLALEWLTWGKAALFLIKCSEEVRIEPWRPVTINCMFKYTKGFFHWLLIFFVCVKIYQACYDLEHCHYRDVLNIYCIFPNVHWKNQEEVKKLRRLKRIAWERWEGVAGGLCWDERGWAVPGYALCLICAQEQLIGMVPSTRLSCHFASWMATAAWRQRIQ